MIVILDNLRSALNVGSIIRTSDAFGIRDIYFCGITPGVDNKKVLKTSLGAESNIKPHTTRSTIEAINLAKKDSYQIVGLEISKNALDIKNFLPNEKIALIVGNEVSGLSEEVIDACDKLVQIPMRGVKESLNVAIAYGIATFVLSGLE